VTRFAFIDVQRATYGVSVLCRVLGVSRSGFYAWAGRPPSSHEVSDAVLTEQIRTAFTSNRSVYGAPRVHAELAADGVRAGRKRVARLMRGAGLVGCHRRKRSFSVTRQDPAAAAAPDLVERSFTATAPNQLWVADVTYVPTVVGWLYLACVTDVFSRMIVGWSMASHRKTELVVDAVTMAVGRRGGHVPGVIHHSDRDDPLNLRSTPATPWSVSCAATGCSRAWAASRTAMTTRWPRACSPPWSASCSTSSPAAGSTATTPPGSRSSTSSRGSTTRAAGSAPCRMLSPAA